MSKLSKLTDNAPQQERIYVSPSLPVADDGDYFSKPVAPVPELPSDNIVERIIKKLAETEFSSGTDIGNKLAGTGGKERYQLWPEKVIRSALTTIPEGMAGKIPTTEVDPETGAVYTSQELIGRAMDMATFAGVGGLGGTGSGGVALGAGPSLRPYKNVPDNLMGFRKNGQQKSFDETNYAHEQPVKITFPDTGDTFVDSIKGLNKHHALERAYRNWEGAEVQPLDKYKLKPVDYEPEF